MKLELFEFIDELMEEISKNSYVLDSAKNEISMFMESLFFEEDYFLSVNSRIKTPESVKEKIIKQDLYKKFDTIDETLDGMSDLIGLRIECRFISDEEKVYKKLIDDFSFHIGCGYYVCPRKKNIALKLDELQPQFQKNGFEIYKIDGIYDNGEDQYNFELQIKSLVNNFWGDIEHRILYKNYNYMLSEQFIKDIMNSIKENLTLIDRQLRVVYNHVNNLNSTSSSYDSIQQIKTVIKKVTYDIYAAKIRDELGLVVDFRPTLDLIVDYVFVTEDGRGVENIAEDFLTILDRLRISAGSEIDFDTEIELSRSLHYEDEKEEKIGSAIEKLVNKDFKWNLFFKIVNDMMDIPYADIIEDFSSYIVSKFVYMTEQITKDLSFADGREDEMDAFLLDTIIENFTSHCDLDYFEKEHIEKLNNFIRENLSGIITWNQWVENRNNIKKMFLLWR